MKADKGKTETLIQYEYEDWSIHDGAMRACILNAYERFKVKISLLTKCLKFPSNYIDSSHTVHSRLSCLALVSKPWNYRSRGFGQYGHGL